MFERSHKIEILTHEKNLAPPPDKILCTPLFHEAMIYNENILFHQHINLAQGAIQ